MGQINHQSSSALSSIAYWTDLWIRAGTTRLSAGPEFVCKKIKINKVHFGKKFQFFFSTLAFPCWPSQSYRKQARQQSIMVGHTLTSRTVRQYSGLLARKSGRVCKWSKIYIHSNEDLENNAKSCAFVQAIKYGQISKFKVQRSIVTCWRFSRILS